MYVCAGHSPGGKNGKNTTRGRSRRAADGGTGSPVVYHPMQRIRVVLMSCIKTAKRVTAALPCSLTITSTSRLGPPAMRNRDPISPEILDFPFDSEAGSRLIRRASSSCPWVRVGQEQKQLFALSSSRSILPRHSVSSCPGWKEQLARPVWVPGAVLTSPCRQLLLLVRERLCRRTRVQRPPSLLEALDLLRR